MTSSMPTTRTARLRTRHGQNHQAYTGTRWSVPAKVSALLHHVTGEGHLFAAYFTDASGETHADLTQLDHDVCTAEPTRTAPVDGLAFTLGAWSQVWVEIIGSNSNARYRAQFDCITGTLDRVLNMDSGLFVYNRFACPPVYAVRPARVATPAASTSSMKGA
jgi:hypothetical protein